MTEPEPVTYLLRRDDLAYIVDALLDSAEARRKRGGNLNERIADRLEELALDLHDSRIERVQSA